MRSSSPAASRRAGSIGRRAAWQSGGQRHADSRCRHVAVLVLACLPVVAGQVPEPNLVNIPQLGRNNHLGCSTAILGDLAVVGACGSKVDGYEGAGHVQGISISSRQPTGTVVSPAPGRGHHFGSSLAISESKGSGILLVGAPNEPAGFYVDVGYVYVYSFDVNATASGGAFEGSFVTRLYAEEAAPNDQFGTSVAMFEDRIVVGAPGPHFYPAGIATVNDAGKVFVFDLTTGEQLALLQPRTDGYEPQIQCYRFGESVAIASGLVVVGAPKAKYPCAKRTRSGAIFTYSLPDDGFGMRSRDTPWWWQESGTYNQTNKILPPERYTEAGQVDFGRAIALTQNVWRDDLGKKSTILVVGGPAIENYHGGIFMLGPFDTRSPTHEGIKDNVHNFVAPATFGDAAYYGSSLSVDPASGLMLIGATNGLSAHGYAGMVDRTWMLRDTYARESDLALFNGNGYERVTPLVNQTSVTQRSLTSYDWGLLMNVTFNVTNENGKCLQACGGSGPCPSFCGTDGACCKLGVSGFPECDDGAVGCSDGHCCSVAQQKRVPAMIPPAWASLPLQDVPTREFSAYPGDPDEHFGSSVSLAPDGSSIIGGDNVTTPDASGIEVHGTGATYIFEPILTSPSTPPASPPPPWRPDWGPPASPSPPLPPPGPPALPPDITLILVPSISGGSIVAIVLVVLLTLGFLKLVAPETYKQVTKRCRKPPFKITDDNGRGPVADQVRAILALEAEKSDVFQAWDKDGGGSASRKEFRTWFSRIGYDAPVDAVNELFDEFDVDGSGEIDEDEFKTAFELRGELWRELGDAQKQHNETESIHKAIAELEKKVKKKQQQLIIDNAAVKSIEDAQAENEEALSGIDGEIAELTKTLAEHQARLDAFKGGIKSVMKKTKVVNAFKAALTPDEAAIAIQSRVKGRTARREVQAKIAAKKAAAEENAAEESGGGMVQELDP